MMDSLQSRDRLYIISELCEGGNLYNFILSQGKDEGYAGKFSEDMAIRVLFQITKAVNYIHGKGIVHRDIKSGNVLLKAGLQIKLADFGFADFLKPRNQPEKFNVGSPVYMSPEAYMYSQYSTKSDVWSLGMIFYEMLVGGQPFAQSTFERVLEAICCGRLVASLPNSVSYFSRTLMERMFHTDPNCRPDTTEILNYLGNYIRGQANDSRVVRSRSRNIMGPSPTLVSGK